MTDEGLRLLSRKNKIVGGLSYFSDTQNVCIDASREHRTPSEIGCYLISSSVPKEVASSLPLSESYRFLVFKGATYTTKLDFKDKCNARVM